MLSVILKKGYQTAQMQPAGEHHLSKNNNHNHWRESILALFFALIAHLK